MRKTIEIETDKPNGLYDLTDQVHKFVKESKAQNGIVHVYVRHATAAIMIQENWDESVQTDVVNLLKKLIPSGVWLHDRQDGNGDAHLKSGIVGPSEPFHLLMGTSRSENGRTSSFASLTVREKERSSSQSSRITEPSCRFFPQRKLQQSLL